MPNIIDLTPLEFLVFSNTRLNNQSTFEFSNKYFDCFHFLESNSFCNQ